MHERATGLAQTLIGERQVDGIGVGRGQPNGGLVGRDRILEAAGFVEHVTQVEVCQRVARVGGHRQPIVRLGRFQTPGGCSTASPG